MQYTRRRVTYLIDLFPNLSQTTARISLFCPSNIIKVSMRLRSFYITLLKKNHHKIGETNQHQTSNLPLSAICRWYPSISCTFELGRHKYGEGKNKYFTLAHPCWWNHASLARVFTKMDHRSARQVHL